MSFRYAAGINKPGFNPLGPQTTTYFNLYGWGQNSNGELGLGNTTAYSSPKQLSSTSLWTSLVNQSAATLAVQQNGTLWSWGSGSSGALGLGNTTSYSSPKQVGALTNWASVFKTLSSCFAIKTDGTLWAWGYNLSGQLGLGNTTNYSSPKQVGSLTNWLKVAGAGYYSVVAIKTDGTLWSWGKNNSGQLGLGNVTDYSSPKQVGALTNWLNISGGGYVGNWLAVKTDGTLWGCGKNNAGQLGVGNLTTYSSPKQIGSLTNWLNVSSGNYHTVATKSSGQIWSWGANNFGQLGLGNTTYYSSPKQIGALTDWLKISCGNYYSSLSVKTDGTLWAWGAGGNGRLGNGSTANRSSPVQVGSETYWATPVMGWYSGMALTT